MRLKHRAGWTALFLLSFLLPAISEEARWRFHVDLVDGSRIVGSPPGDSLKVIADFARLEIPLKRIHTVDWDGDSKLVRIELNNKDVVNAALVEPRLTLTTLFGPAVLEMKHVRSIEVWPPAVMVDLPSKRDLVLYYPFDRAARENVRSQVSHMHAGMQKGSRWSNEGLRGGAVRFDGSSRIEVPHHLDLCPESLTVGAWLHPEGNQARYQIIIAKTDPSSWQGGYGLIRMPGDAKNVYFFINGYTTSVVKAEIPNDKWSHVAGVCDGKNVSLFVNGKQVSSVPMKANPAPGPAPRAPGAQENVPRPESIRHSTSPLWIGSDSSGYAWTGKLDEVVLYRRALSPEEIRRLYNTLAPQR